MGLSLAWFIGLFMLAIGMYLLGRRLGPCRPWLSHSAIGLAVICIGLGGALRFRPVLLHQLLPLDVSIWIDGLIPLFPWMMLVGILATGEMPAHLRRATWLMLTLGIVYFVFGAVWMVLPNIKVGEAENRSPVGIIIQNRHDTCVPASCANALRIMGIPASEERMCAVVLAKPSRGSSIARAAWGLGPYVARYDMKVSLRDLSAAQVAETASRDRPVLVVIRSGIAADHMVAVLGYTHDGNVLIANPSPGEHGGVPALPVDLGYGLEVFAPDDFARLYRRGAIVFEDLVEAPEGLLIPRHSQVPLPVSWLRSPRLW